MSPHYSNFRLSLQTYCTKPTLFVSLYFDSVCHKKSFHIMLRCHVLPLVNIYTSTLEVASFSSFFLSSLFIRRKRRKEKHHCLHDPVLCYCFHILLTIVLSTHWVIITECLKGVFISRMYYGILREVNGN